MNIIITFLKIILAMAHTVMHSFTSIFVGLAKFIRGVSIFCIVLFWFTSLLGKPVPDYTYYIMPVVLIILSTLFEVFYRSIVDSIGDYLYSEEVK